MVPPGPWRPYFRIRQLFVDIHILVDGNQSLRAAHELTEEIERAIQKLVPDADVTVHPNRRRAVLGGGRGRGRVGSFVRHVNNVAPCAAPFAPIGCCPRRQEIFPRIVAGTLHSWL